MLFCVVTEALYLCCEYYGAIVIELCVMEIKGSRYVVCNGDIIFVCISGNCDVMVL